MKKILENRIYNLLEEYKNDNNVEKRILIRNRINRLKLLLSDLYFDEYPQEKNGFSSGF